MLVRKIYLFGYVNVYKNELKIKDYNIFKAYYCGLCKALGKRYNQLVRLGLSYDLTFLALIADSLSADEAVIKKDGCIKHIGSHMICTGNRAIDYAADISIILSYYKFCDDIKDDKSVKAFFARIPYLSAFKKASKKYPGVAMSIKDNLNELSQLEKEKCSSIDMAAHPFAKLTSDLFAGFSPELSKLGYNIGRYIYIADAFNDITDDKKRNSYNPFLNYSEEYLESMDFEKRVLGTFNMTLNAISDSYSKLQIKKNKPILDNIIYLGLRYITEQFFNNGGKNDKSL